MGIMDKFLNQTKQVDEKTKDLIDGKIIHVSKTGWGFITSREIPFTRIFFHWTGLEGDTYKFTELKKGMKIQFKPIETEEKKIRAVKIRVIDNKKENNQ